MSHTYALLELSYKAYQEIFEKMKAAGYDHAFGYDGEIDMHGIAIIQTPIVQQSPIDAWDSAMCIVS